MYLSPSWLYQVDTDGLAELEGNLLNQPLALEEQTDSEKWRDPEGSLFPYDTYWMEALGKSSPSSKQWRRDCRSFSLNSASWVVYTRSAQLHWILSQKAGYLLGWSCWYACGFHKKLLNHVSYRSSIEISILLIQQMEIQLWAGGSVSKIALSLASPGLQKKLMRIQGIHSDHLSLKPMNAFPPGERRRQL